MLFKVMNFWNPLLSFIAAFGLFGMWGFVLKKSPNKSYRQAFLIFAFSGFVYTATSGIKDLLRFMINWNIYHRAIPLNIHEIVLWGHFFGCLGLIAGAYLTAASGHLAIKFPFQVSKGDQKPSVLALYTISTLSLIGMFSQLYPFGKEYFLIYDPIHQIVEFNSFRFFWPYVVFVLGIIIGSSILMCIKIKKAPQAQKQQTWILGSGMIVGFVTIFIFALLLPLLGTSEYLGVGKFGFFITALGAFVAITQYGAFDIKTAVHYTIYWGSVSFGVLVPVYGVIYLFSPPGWPTHLLFGAVICIVGVTILYMKYVQTKLNDLFFRRRHELKEATIALTEHIAEQVTHDGVILTISNAFTKLMYTQKTAWLTQPDSTATLNIPLVFRGKAYGFLVLYDKKTLKPYSPTERQFVLKISHACAIALNNIALFRELRDAEREKEQQEQRQAHANALAKGIIHEVKNTHFAISSFAKLILDKGIQEWSEIAAILSIMGEQSSKLHLFAKNYLNQEQRGTEMGTLRITQVNLKEWVEKAIQSNFFLITINKLTITSHITPQDTVFADASKLHLVLSNLINNSASHGAEGTLTIFKNDTANMTLLTFVSEGKTIGKQPTATHGTGFGLQISTQIIEQHGGYLKTHQHSGRFEILVALPHTQV